MSIVRNTIILENNRFKILNRIMSNLYNVKGDNSKMYYLLDISKIDKNNISNRYLLIERKGNKLKSKYEFIFLKFNFNVLVEKEKNSNDICSIDYFKLINRNYIQFNDLFFYDLDDKRFYYRTNVNERKLKELK